MAQVSKRKPHFAVQEKIKKLFSDCLCSNQDPSTLNKFLHDFLTSTEKTILGKRLAIALMLLKNNSIEEISDTLKVSGSTVHKIRVWLETSGGGLKELLKETVNKDQRIEKRHKQALKDYDSSPLWHMTNWKNLKARQRQKIKDTESPF